MIKFSQNTDFDFDIESVQIITDNKQLQKRASAKHLLKYSKTKGQTDLHIIALGAFEGTGLNRNGDGFTEKDCVNNHHYFKKADRAVHRHHKNKPESPKYGNIKAAAYNQAMKRIELIVGLDDDKCQDILQEQEKTGNTNWSMASKQAYDYCTWCKHKATSDADRCEHIPNKIGEINKIGEMCGMMNPDPKWFEISYVYRPADRIGMSLGKLASYGKLKPMLTRDFLNIYTDFVEPEELLISKKASDKRTLLNKLAELEKYIEGSTKTDKGSLIPKVKQTNEASKMDATTIDELRKYEPGKVLKILADHGIVFSPEDFSKYLFADRVKEENVEGMKSNLPGIFGKLKEDPQIANDEKFEPGCGGIPKELQRLIESLEDEHSFNEEPAVRRMIRISIMGGGPNNLKKREESSKEAFDKELAKVYATYKLAALNYMNENNKLDDCILLHSVVQNY